MIAKLKAYLEYYPNADCITYNSKLGHWGGKNKLEYLVKNEHALIGVDCAMLLLPNGDYINIK